MGLSCLKQLGFLIATACFAITPAFAQSASPTTSKPTSDELQGVNRQIEQSEQREKQINRELTALEKETQEISQKLITLAAKTQHKEENISDSERKE